jgi:hypothetical protein
LASNVAVESHGRGEQRRRSPKRAKPAWTVGSNGD